MQAIEVLLVVKAFVVKRFADNLPPARSCVKGQVSWGKFETVGAAWREAKSRCGFKP